MSIIKVSANIGELSGSGRYRAVIQSVGAALESSINIGSKEALEDEPEYKLILECNRLIFDIDEEIIATQHFVCELYNKKFPELETLIPNRIDYIKTVKKIGNEMDMTLVDLDSVLSSALVMIVSVTGSTTSGLPLRDQELVECFRGCDEVLRLEADKALILRFVESRMSRIAPNLCAMVGANIAAQLVGLAGGLVALSKIPACNVQVMGQEKKNLAGLSNASIVPHTGVLFQCEIVQGCPPYLRRKALKVVAGKVTLACRVDSYQSDFSSAEGHRLRRDIEDKLEKMQEPDKARTKKALPVPEEKRRTKRGGQRVRRLKESYQVTELRKQQNKMVFSADGGEYGDSAMGFDNGMVGSKESGRIRAAQAQESKFSAAAKRQKKAVSVSSGQTSGLSSSMVFTPMQGLELVNPNAAAERVKAANNKWFSSQTGFLSAVPK